MIPTQIFNSSTKINPSHYVKSEIEKLVSFILLPFTKKITRKQANSTVFYCDNSK